MTRVLQSVADLRAQVAAWRRAGDSIGLVPTMGALHEGHLSLVRAAKAQTARVIVTIFVNPMQFNNAADLAKYPRTQEADLALLTAADVDVLFAPSAEEVYPDGFVTTIRLDGVALPLEGGARPGHFDGVATVVAKLFGMSGADHAFFGEKDWQQLQVIRRMVTDLNLPIAVTGCETLRESDGLAMSSRNMRLSPAARKVAPALYAAMTRARAALPLGQVQALESCAQEILAAGFERIDYIELRDAETLLPTTSQDRPARLLAAAWLDGVRLIDNIPV